MGLLDLPLAADGPAHANTACLTVARMFARSGNSADSDAYQADNSMERPH